PPLTHHYFPYSSCSSYNATPTTEIYTLSLHDALPILQRLGAIALSDDHFAARYAADRRPLGKQHQVLVGKTFEQRNLLQICQHRDRKSTRLNSSHVAISYAVFCLKKKKYAHEA